MKTSYYKIIEHEDGWHHVNLCAKNNRVIATSGDTEMNIHEANAYVAHSRFLSQDENNFEIYTDADGLKRFRLMLRFEHSEDSVIMKSEGYVSNARRGIKSFMRISQSEDIFVPFKKK